MARIASTPAPRTISRRARARFLPARVSGGSSTGLAAFSAWRTSRTVVGSAARAGERRQQHGPKQESASLPYEFHAASLSH